MRLGIILFVPIEWSGIGPLWVERFLPKCLITDFFTWIKTMRRWWRPHGNIDYWHMIISLGWGWRWEWSLPQRWTLCYWHSLVWVPQPVWALGILALVQFEIGWDLLTRHSQSWWFIDVLWTELIGIASPGSLAWSTGPARSFSWFDSHRLIRNYCPIKVSNSRR